MNNWIFTGNLGQDCDVRYTASGTAICTFSVAVKSGYGDKAKTTWVKCGLFGKRAEGALPQHLLKGTQVCISGEAYLDEWQGQDGQANKMLKLNVDKLDLIGGKPGAASGRQEDYRGNGGPASPNPTTQPANPPEMDSFDDDIPF